MQTNIPYFDPSDVEKNKTMAGLAYILFFLPLLACPDSQYAKFHANQALLNAILMVACWIIGWFGLLGSIISGIGYFVVGIFSIMGLINGFKGMARRMPLYGQFDILK